MLFRSEGEDSGEELGFSGVDRGEGEDSAGDEPDSGGVDRSKGEDSSKESGSGGLDSSDETSCDDWDSEEPCSGGWTAARSWVV